MHPDYESLYIQLLRQCRVLEAKDRFQREMAAWRREKNYECLIRAAIYWARIQLLLSEYPEAEQKIEQLQGEAWYNSMPPFLRARLALIRAKLHYTDGAWQQSEQLTLQALRTARQSPERQAEDEDYFYCRAYLILAKIHWRRRDILRAKLYMGHSWNAYCDNRQLPGHYLKARLLSHFGQIALKGISFQQTEHFFEHSRIEYQRQDYLDHFYLPETLKLHAESLIENQQFEVAREKLKQAMWMVERNFPNNMNRHKAHLFHLVGRSYLDEAECHGPSPDKLKLAQVAFNKELKLRMWLFRGRPHVTIIKARNYLSRVCTLRHDFISALQQAGDALRTNLPNQGLPASSAPPKLKDLKKAKSTNEALRSLYFKAFAFWKRCLFSPTQHQKDATAAWNWVLKAQQAIFQVRDEHFDLQSKMTIGLLSRDIYELGLEILWEAKEQAIELPQEAIADRVFDFFYYSKSSLLLESLPATAPRPPNVPGRPLSALVRKIENCYESGLLARLDEEAADIEGQLQEQPAPNARIEAPGRPENGRRIRLKDIEEELGSEKENGTIISYFMGRRGLFAIVISGRNALSFHRLAEGRKAVQALKQETEQLSKLFTEFRMEDVSAAVVPAPANLLGMINNPNVILLRHAFQLYRKLIAPLQLPEAERIYLIPDGELFNVPFPFLCEEPNRWPADFSGFPYLATRYKITYHISTSMLYHNHRREMEAGRFLPLSPSALRELHLFSIPGQEINPNGVVDGKFNAPNENAVDDSAEVLNINGQRHRKATGKAAKRLLREHLPGKPHIFHFFGHSYSRQKHQLTPGLLLLENLKEHSREVLPQEEIQELDFQDNVLVLLNACRGGQGQLQSGEAPVSIVQSFLKARAKNIYYALFKIEQGAAAEFTEAYLKKLARGYTFVDALTETQRTFIKSGGRKSHPTVWASPSFIGNQMQRIVNRQL